MYSVKGDANADGVFDVSDLVLLQKWLFSVPDANFENWQAVDFCKDSELYIFDLALAKRKLTEKSNSELIGSPDYKAAAFACADDDELYEGFVKSYRQIKGDAQLLFDKENNTVWIMW